MGVLGTLSMCGRAFRNFALAFALLSADPGHDISQPESFGLSQIFHGHVHGPGDASSLVLAYGLLDSQEYVKDSHHPPLSLRFPFKNFVSLLFAPAITVGLGSCNVT